MKAQPRSRSALAERHALLEVPAALDPVGGRDAHAHRHVCRHGGAHRVEHLQRKAHAVLQRAAVVIAARVRQRREELVQQVAMRRVQFDRVEAQAMRALRGRSAKACSMRCRPARVQRHRRRPRRRRAAAADGATGCQPPVRRARSAAPPSQGAWLEALRPACASWIAIGIGECRRTAASTRRSAASVASDHSPRSPGVMRPSGSTAVASMVSRPAPDSARWPRWIRCQSLASPSIGAVLAHRRDDDAVASATARRGRRARRAGSCSCPGRSRSGFRIASSTIRRIVDRHDRRDRPCGPVQSTRRWRLLPCAIAHSAAPASSSPSSASAP